MSRILVFLYGTLCYGVFFATFLYLVGFLAGSIVPRTVDSGEAGAVGTAIAINAALILLFGIQHTVMARPGFKRWIMRMVPRPVERSTYVLLSSAALILLMWAWRPIPDAIWSAEGDLLRGVLHGLFLSGVLLVLYSTFLIDHFDLFGLRQVFLHLRNRPYTDKKFQTPSLYRRMRHPLYLGWMIAFWAGPDMSVGRLLLASLMTGYIFIAIVYEERDLIAHFGNRYLSYKATTPMILPRLRGRRTV